MIRFSICALAFFAVIYSSDCLAADTTQSPALPEIQTERVCVPVRSSRSWSTALAPNGRGGFNFITQLYEVKSTKPTEYVVLDLQTGKFKVTERPSGQYTNSNYQHANEARARNGRIFFSEAGNVLAYYDPTDESIKELGQVIDPSNG